MACTLFGAVSPKDPDVLQILAGWRASCRADGKFPRANHGWRMITLYCCDGPSDPLPSTVAVNREELTELDVVLELELTDEGILDLYNGNSLKLKGGRGQIALVTPGSNKGCRPCCGKGR